jgi:hypothetical protein
MFSGIENVIQVFLAYSTEGFDFHFPPQYYLSALVCKENK